MTWKHGWVIACPLLIVMPMAVACGGDDGPTELNLTFDGESCVYDGPTEFGPGPVELTFVNDSTAGAAVNFVELLEGKTVDDVIEDIGPEPSQGHAPSWTRELGTWKTMLPGETQLWEGELAEAEYAMVCAQVSPLLVWFGTGLTVSS